MNLPTPECEEESLLHQASWGPGLATQNKLRNRPIKQSGPLEKALPRSSSRKPDKILLIAGPTACGKTALSLLVAELLHGEIISADSMQVYQGMDIGTAKVSPEDQARIPHHLIDIRQVHESFNVVDFYYEAKQCCASILARDKVPVLVGGAGFYFRALIYGPPQGPPSLPEIRAALEEEVAEKGLAPLYRRLQETDPIYAATVTSNDRQKIMRALEIILLTGRGVSQQKWQIAQPLPEFDYRCWFVYRPKERLYPAIERRCEQMLERGLIDEVRELEKQGLRTNLSASQAIGYRQCLDFLASPQDEKAYRHFVQRFKAASRQYAKRQLTWFRKEPLFRWLNIETHDLEITAEILVQDFLNH